MGSGWPGAARLALFTCSSRVLWEGANLDVCEIWGWFVQKTGVRCPQQDPRVQRRCLKSRQKKLERYMSHIRVFSANYLAHKKPGRSCLLWR